VSPVLDSMPRLLLTLSTFFLEKLDLHFYILLGSVSVMFYLEQTDHQASCCFKAHNLKYVHKSWLQNPIPFLAEIGHPIVLMLVQPMPSSPQPCQHPRSLGHKPIGYIFRCQPCILTTFHNTPVSLPLGWAHKPRDITIYLLWPSKDKLEVMLANFQFL
jgi:hypothetical protein